MTQSLGDDSRFDRRGKPRMECAYDAIVKSILPNGRYFEENATVHNLSASGVFLTVNRLIIDGQILFLKIAFPTGSLEWGSAKLNSTGVVVRTKVLNDELLGVAVKFENYQFS